LQTVAHRTASGRKSFVLHALEMFGTTSCWTAVLLVVAAVAGQTVPGDREDQRQAKGVQMFGAFDFQ
jgi:hypothetical protein